MSIVLTHTGATVVCQHETIGAVAEAALWRWVATILTAQGRAAFQTCEEKKGGREIKSSPKEDLGFTLMAQFSVNCNRRSIMISFVTSFKSHLKTVIVICDHLQTLTCKKVYL